MLCAGNKDMKLVVMTGSGGVEEAGAQPGRRRGTAEGRGRGPAGAPGPAPMEGEVQAAGLANHARLSEIDLAKTFATWPPRP